MEPADSPQQASPGVRVLRGGEVLVSGDAVAWLASACQLAAGVHRSNGVGRRTRFDELRQTFALAVQASGGFAGVVAAPSALPPASAMADPISVSEAARFLGSSPQNVTQLCRRGSLTTAARVGRRWLIERAEVVERARSPLRR